MIIELTLQFNNFELLILFAVAIIFFFILLTDIKKQGKRMTLTTPEVKVQLLCEKCGFKEIRDFKEGDYISKKPGEKCEKCGGDMYIDIIYSITKQEGVKQ